MALCQLCVGLFVVDEFAQQLVAVGLFGIGAEFVADGTFISLSAVFTAVFDEGVLAAEGTFFTNIGKKSLK